MGRGKNDLGAGVLTAGFAAAGITTRPTRAPLPAATQPVGPRDVYLPSGKVGVAQGRTPPPHVLEVMDKWLLEIPDFTVGQQKYGNLPDPGTGLSWDVRCARLATDTEVAEFVETLSRDGKSCVFGDYDDGYYVSATPNDGKWVS